MIGKGDDCLFPLYIPIDGHSEKLRVRCGHCINCKIHRAREWCIRLEAESYYWRNICFVTLTYNDDNLPKHIIDGNLFYDEEEIAQHPELSYIYEPTLRPDHLTLFLKRLRKSGQGEVHSFRTARFDEESGDYLGDEFVERIGLRYFAVGEYGTKLGRSHLHLILFGVPYVKFQTEYILQKLWPYGFVVVRPFFPETCTYIAGYVQKKLYGREKYLFKLPEFMRCSQHLGEDWLLDNISSFDDGHPYICKNGYKYGLPRQFRKILISRGILSETSLIGTALIQKKEYLDLCEDLKSKNTSLTDFFSNRLKIALEKEKRKLNSRMKTGDI